MRATLAVRLATLALGCLKEAIMVPAPRAVRSVSLLLASVLVPLASTQTTVAVESFNFGQVGTLLGGNGSGFGWLGPWDAGPNNDHAVLTAGFNFGAGLHARLNGSAVPCFRALDTSLHPDLAEGGYYGRDGAVLWVRFDVHEVTHSTANHYFGGLSLLADATEELFIGVPWGLQMWGLDTFGSGIYSVAGSNDNVHTRLTTRIDFAAAGDRLRLWLNPTAYYPTAVPDLDVTVPHFTFNRLRLDNGGSGAGANARFHFDAIRLETPPATIGTNYCYGDPNSSGALAFMSASGSSVVAANDLVLRCSSMPMSSFALFLTSQQQAFISWPGGMPGVLCLGGSIGRYSDPGQIQNSGALGEVALAVDLTQHPTPTGFLTVHAGETWNFTCWFRDSTWGYATNNFANGLSIAFQ
jgi:hypothetical protein